MHIPTRADRLLLAAGALALLPSCGAPSASTGGSLPSGAMSAQRLVEVRQVAGPSTLPRIPERISAIIPLGVKIPPNQRPSRLPGPVPEPCSAVYLSDGPSQMIDLYEARPPYHLFGQLTGYGQGVASDENRVYAGQAAADKIDEYAPCSSKLLKTLVGKAGAPSIVAVDNAGTVYDAHFASTTVEIFADGGPSFYTATAPAVPYGLVSDPKFNIYLAGWNISFTHTEVSRCLPGMKSCGSFSELPSPSFPGGLAIAKDGTVIVDDQYGTIYTYNSAGVLLHAFKYNNGANPLDYTAIALSGDGKKVWGANIYLCSSSIGLCGDAQAQKYARNSGKVGPLRGATGGIENGQPSAIAVYPPAPT